jgi:hypothetical protein
LPEDVAHVHILDQTITVTDSPVCADADLTEGMTSGHAQPEQMGETDICGNPRPSARFRHQATQAMALQPDISNGRSGQKTTFANLPKCAAQAIIKTFDPFFLAAYHYERAKFYEGIKLLGQHGLLNGVSLKDAYGVDNPDLLRFDETHYGMEMIRYCLGLDTSGEANDRPDERNLPYDKHTRVRALNVWGLFDVLDKPGPEQFEQAERRFAEAVQLASSDPKLKRELAFVYSNWGAIHYAWKGIGTPPGAQKQNAQTYSSRLFKRAIHDGHMGYGYEDEAEVFLDEQDYRAARRNLAASVDYHQGSTNQGEAEVLKEWGDTFKLIVNADPRQTKRAISLYHKAIDADASLASAHIGLGLVLQYEKNVLKEEAELTKDMTHYKAEFCRAILLYRTYPEQLPDVSSLRRTELDEAKKILPEYSEPTCRKEFPDAAMIR